MPKNQTFSLRFQLWCRVRSKSQGAPSILFLSDLYFSIQIRVRLLFFNGVLNVFVLEIWKVDLFIPQAFIWSILLSYNSEFSKRRRRKTGLIFLVFWGTWNETFDWKLNVNLFFNNFPIYCSNFPVLILLCNW